MAARVFLPADADAEPGPGDHRVHPVPEARPHRDQQRAVPSLPRGSRVRGRSARDPRFRRVRWNPARRISRPGAGRRRRGDRVAGRQPWCSRQGRDHRQFLGRLQRPPDRGPPATGARGDRHVLLHGRPLRRRHALHGRLPADRHARLGDDVPGAAGAAARSRRSSASAGARCGRQRLADVSVPLEDWLAPPASRRVLESMARSTRTSRRSRCPVLAVGGWLDGYSNAIPRLLAGLSVPRRAVIGPWAHAYPHLGVPGPGYDFLAEAVRWFDHWLKGVPTTGRWTGRCCGPGWRRRCRLGRSTRRRRGAGSARTDWPSPRIEERRWHLGDGRLGGDPVGAAGGSLRHAWASPRLTGLAGGEWCPYGTGGRGPEFPGDQREDDGRSLTWDSAPLAESTGDPRSAGRGTPLIWRSTGRRRSSPSGCATWRPTGRRPG